MKTSNDISKSKDSKYIIVLIATMIIIIGMWLLPILLLKDLRIQDRENYSDMLSTINSLFSGLALAGIILTILLQRNELSLQRLELKETREGLKRSSNAPENSEIALNRQAENLKISAILSALNSLVSFYSELELSVMKGIPNPGSNLPDIIAKKNEYVQRIEKILENTELKV